MRRKLVDQILNDFLNDLLNAFKKCKYYKALEINQKTKKANEGHHKECVCSHLIIIFETCKSDQQSTNFKLPKKVHNKCLSILSQITQKKIQLDPFWIYVSIWSIWITVHLLPRHHLELQMLESEQRQPRLAPSKKRVISSKSFCYFRFISLTNFDEMPPARIAQCAA